MFRSYRGRKAFLSALCVLNCALLFAEPTDIPMSSMAAGDSIKRIGDPVVQLSAIPIDPNVGYGVYPDQYYHYPNYLPYPEYRAEYFAEDGSRVIETGISAYEFRVEKAIGTPLLLRYRTPETSFLHYAFVHPERTIDLKYAPFIALPVRTPQEALEVSHRPYTWSEAIYLIAYSSLGDLSVYPSSYQFPAAVYYGRDVKAIVEYSTGSPPFMHHVEHLFGKDALMGAPPRFYWGPEVGVPDEEFVFSMPGELPIGEILLTLAVDGFCTETLRTELDKGESYSWRPLFRPLEGLSATSLYASDSRYGPPPDWITEIALNERLTSRTLVSNYLFHFSDANEDGVVDSADLRVVRERIEAEDPIQLTRLKEDRND